MYTEQLDTSMDQHVDNDIRGDFNVVKLQLFRFFYHNLTYNTVMERYKNESINTLKESAVVFIKAVHGLKCSRKISTRYYPFYQPFETTQFIYHLPKYNVMYGFFLK